MILSRGARRLQSKRNTWAPLPHTLARIQSYLAGFAAHGRPIYARRKHIAARLGLAVRTLTRYLAYLRDIGWLETLRRTARTAIRKVVKYKPTGPSTGPSKEVKPRSDLPSAISSCTSIERHHHLAESDDAARKAANMKRLSEGDRRWLGHLRQSGTPETAILGGITIGRARKLACATASEPVRSLRYYANTIREALTLPQAYLDHAAGWLKRHAG